VEQLAVGQPREHVVIRHVPHHELDLAPVGHVADDRYGTLLAVDLHEPGEYLHGHPSAVFADVDRIDPHAVLAEDLLTPHRVRAPKFGRDPAPGFQPQELVEGVAPRFVRRAVGIEEPSAQRVRHHRVLRRVEQQGLEGQVLRRDPPLRGVVDHADEYRLARVAQRRSHRDLGGEHTAVGPAQHRVDGTFRELVVRRDHREHGCDSRRPELQHFSADEVVARDAEHGARRGIGVEDATALIHEKDGVAGHLGYEPGGAGQVGRAFGLHVVRTRRAVRRMRALPPIFVRDIGLWSLVRERTDTAFDERCQSPDEPPESQQDRATRAFAIQGCYECGRMFL
jgi:hypothetical protein